MSALKPAVAYRPRIERLCAALGRDASGDAGRAFVAAAATYAELVEAWNPRINLTSASGPDELVDLLFADAVALLAGRAVGVGERWVDVGSGMGAPGVALALLEPRLEMTLVEPRAKRVAFLRTLLHRLERADVAVERSRSEALAPSSFDVAVSRATFPPSEWLCEGARLAKRDVWVLLADDEPPALDGFRIDKVVEFEWPLTRKSRRTFCYRRESESVDS